MGGTPSVQSMLSNAKKALDNANKFTKSVTGGQPNAFAPKKPSPSKYSYVHQARKDPDSFLGVQSDQGAELKAAEASRQAAKDALNQ